MTCLVCQQQGEAFVPGGLLDPDPLVVVYQRPPGADGLAYSGHLLVTTRRHAVDVAALTDEEAAAVGRVTSRYARALQALGATRVYTATVGHGAEHLHVHLLPRWPETPASVLWHAVDQWPEGRRSTAEGIAELMGRLEDAPGNDNQAVLDSCADIS